MPWRRVHSTCDNGGRDGLTTEGATDETREGASAEDHGGGNDGVEGATEEGATAEGVTVEGTIRAMHAAHVTGPKCECHKANMVSCTGEKKQAARTDTRRPRTRLDALSV